MDDVDRLFECFKCGISPPESAERGRKRCKSKLNQGNSTRGLVLSPPTPLPGSAGQKQTSRNALLSAEKCVSATTKANKFGGGKQVSPVVFYGSPHGVPPKRPLSLLRLLHEIRIDLSDQETSSLSKEIWATFPRQEEAMRFAKGHANVRMFSYQDHFSGQRRFLVSTYTEFWRRYKSMDGKLRHHYEVIQESLPCHLYFDLEYSKKVNVDRNGDEMVDLLISIVLEALRAKYSIEGSQDWIVELDSSTEEKFSRHLIIRIPKTAFKDNTHAGAFVGEVCSRIATSRGRDERFENLFVRKDSNSTDDHECTAQLFVDTAVYSRNRCFRLALSSKAGKTSVLLPTRRFKCKDMSDEDMFMASLICNMETDCQKFLVCKMELDCARTLHFDTEVTGNIASYSKAPRFVSSGTNAVSTTYMVGKSPFPVLDEFIEHIATIGNVSGKIRSWYWFSEYGLMVYSMSRNRYCERIGRQHKSNHVMYVVDLQTAAYYQKCYDPDCRGYRSPLRQVPEDCIPESFSYLAFQQTGGKGELAGNITEFRLVDNNDAVITGDHESNTDTCADDAWWLEAVKLADTIESKGLPVEDATGSQQDKLAPEAQDIDEDEDGAWWMAVERVASQVEVELAHVKS